MSTLLPDALRLAWWGTAWLRGHVVADHLIDEVVADQATHAVHGLRELGLGGAETETLVGGLGRLRAEGADTIGAAFPAEGLPIGLGGPPPFNAAALDAGEAVVVSGPGVEPPIGLVPVVVGRATTWVAQPARRRPLVDLGEADRGLRAALPAAADLLARLDVARWRPEAADLLLNLRHRERVAGPPGVPARAVDLAVRGLQALEICDVALEDDGGAVSLGEAQARVEALRPLARAAREALVAAGSPEGWPPGD
ncbi:hypothetical protein [Nocardioides sp. GY 10127]|uniref:hypothetical protein n=1 Tax=Nocardioides sp. GY 10127 TaxID=2569762 RepID=UPI0010A803F1|nr:hypothetical protein [Nocardioides sp. GY 10127]TIC86523.1 hypothetical protein E8D37_01105 [Nocardioides sp. GY 10127]